MNSCFGLAIAALLSLITFGLAKPQWSMLFGFAVAHGPPCPACKLQSCAGNQVEHVLSAALAAVADGSSAKIIACWLISALSLVAIAGVCSMTGVKLSQSLPKTQAIFICRSRSTKSIQSCSPSSWLQLDVIATLRMRTCSTAWAQVHQTGSTLWRLRREHSRVDRWHPRIDGLELKTQQLATACRSLPLKDAGSCLRLSWSDVYKWSADSRSMPI